ncbi:unnamed protein product [Brachionus calyciflorus]|uniref:Uncharacterized protein n=1 Tax=Brachionus calyciflorus TaxID=104777 RepID=A0A814K742_9BILA|nr:unnamed protein product [Brachionus calyciflorus]
MKIRLFKYNIKLEVGGYLNMREPQTIDEAFTMAIQYENNVLKSKIMTLEYKHNFKNNRHKSNNETYRNSNNYNNNYNYNSNFNNYTISSGKISNNNNYRGNANKDNGYNDSKKTSTINYFRKGC